MSKPKPQPDSLTESAARLTWRGYDGVILHATAVSSRHDGVEYHQWCNFRDGAYGCDCPGYHSHQTCWHVHAVLDGACVFIETFKTLWQDSDDFLRDQYRLLHPRKVGLVSLAWLAARQILRERRQSQPDAA